MISEVWEVYFTAIRMVCSQNYSQEQVKAWAPDDFDMNLFQEKISHLNPFVAKLDSTVVGYADLQEDGLVDHFFVHGKHQSMGVGSALMKAILAKGNGLPRLYSNVSHTATPFFQNYGFVVQQVQDVQVRGCTLQNNVMVRASV